MRTHEELRALRMKNARNQTLSTYDGFSREEIAAYNRRLMFGENDQAFPSKEEWARITD